MILAGDIGGTKTTLAIFDEKGEQLNIIREQKFASRDYINFDEIVSSFAATHETSVARACFGIAGPVKNGRCTATNLPWVVDARHLAKNLGLQSVVLFNDLEANAYGISVLDSDDFVILNPGVDNPGGNAAIIAAGTGLGEAGLYWDGKQHKPFACEGGHVDFAPRNELEIDLLRFLQTRFGSVSYERVLSGPGLYNIYQFLRDTGRGEEPAWLAQKMIQRDPSAVISQTALEGQSDLCVRTLDLFVSLYGAEAGNLALKIMATAGVYIGGGIAPKIIDKLMGEAFMQAFHSKGRMQALLQAVPVRVILNEKTALLGAAHRARLGAAGRPLILV
jgi:glucokinase